MASNYTLVIQNAGNFTVWSPDGQDVIGPGEATGAKAVGYEKERWGVAERQYTHHVALDPRPGLARGET